MRENEKQTDDPVGSEANPKVSEMDRAVGGGGLASEGHGGQGTNHDTYWPLYNFLCSLCNAMAFYGIYKCDTGLYRLYQSTGISMVC